LQPLLLFLYRAVKAPFILSLVPRLDLVHRYEFGGRPGR